MPQIRAVVYGVHDFFRIFLWRLAHFRELWIRLVNFVVLSVGPSVRRVLSCFLSLCRSAENPRRRV